MKGKWVMTTLSLSFVAVRTLAITLNLLFDPLHRHGSQPDKVYPCSSLQLPAAPFQGRGDWLRSSPTGRHEGEKRGSQKPVDPSWMMRRKRKPPEQVNSDQQHWPCSRCYKQSTNNFNKRTGGGSRIWPPPPTYFSWISNKTAARSAAVFDIPA